jgi:hypothetical protein
VVQVANLNPLKGINFHGIVKSHRCKAAQGFKRGILLISMLSEEAEAAKKEKFSYKHKV